MENKLSRREFVKISGATVSGAMLSANSISLSTGNHSFKAVLFDGFPVFDPRPVFNKVRVLFPEQSDRLLELWRTSQFSYQWLRVSANKYKNFWDLTLDALEYAATASGVKLSVTDRGKIMNEYRLMNVWPDVIPAMRVLKNKGLRLGILSNMTAGMLQQGIQNSHMQDLIEFVISTDQRKTYKPSPVAYRMGTDILQLPKEEILFVASAAWDMAGAKWFGYPAFWMNRVGSPAEKLDAAPDGAGKNFNELLDFLRLINR